ncbi:F-box protein At2g02240-like [Bidens hawaiensis]|uniref:F-box protein At2g02240-like n=1 Tax=Bidens hawaiensis TaxID=980011 RepID=UPI0040490A5E
MYVNLKYKMKGKTLHAYFATHGNEEWMMIELCRFVPNKKDVEFEVLLESLSQYYCGSGAIYVEGVHFLAVNDATSKGAGRVLKSISDSVEQVSVDYEEITEVENGAELLSLSKADGKKCHMLPAKMVLYDTSDVNRFDWKSLSESRFVEAVELLSHQVLRIKCKIETQKLSADTNYACYLVFKLSQQCPGLDCPVRVRDLLLRKNKESKFIYFRSPRVVNLHGNERVPRNREDGLMEVIVWEFTSGNNDHHVPMSLKLRCYEGTMSGLTVYGIEFRPI